MAHGLIPECQVMLEDGPDSGSLFNNCEKHPGHPGFIPAKDFRLEHLPEQCQTPKILDFINRVKDKTVKVMVTCTSKKRPLFFPDSDEPYPYSELRGSDRVTRCGTGMIRYVISQPQTNKSCPCPECCNAQQPYEKFWNVVVVTSTHVIYDDIEAAHSVIQCFYDNADMTNVGCLYGRSIRDQMSINCVTDRCSVTCVTHDESLVERLLSLQVHWRGIYQISQLGLSCGIIISHPHGGIKQITIGNICHEYLSITPLFPRNEPHRFGKQLKYRSSSEEEGQANSTDLPYGSTFTLSSNAEYLAEVKKHGTSFWMKYPTGTVFTSPDGEVLPLDPATTEFYCEKMDYYMKHEGKFYLTYDVPTCPGSSGAEIYHHDEVHPRSFLSHAGFIKDKNINKSSLNICLR